MKIRSIHREERELAHARKALAQLADATTDPEAERGLRRAAALVEQRCEELHRLKKLVVGVRFNGEGGV